MRLVMQDLKFALRQLWKCPGFTLVVVLTLALGIGVATAMFSAIHGVLLRPLPFPRSERLVTVRSWLETEGGRDFPYAFGASAPDYQDWAERSRSFEQLAAASFEHAALLGGEYPRQLVVLGVTGNYFDVFQVPMALGRGFSADEASMADGSRIVLSHAFWAEAFGADPGVVGRTLKFETGPSVVIGVAAPEIDFRRDVRPQIYRPLRLRGMHRGDRMLWTFGRLRPGVTLAQASAEMNALAAHLKKEHPDTDVAWGARVWPLHEVLTRSIRRPLALLYSAAAAILVLACVNVATLMLVRATGRQQEIAVRTALGANRPGLVRLLLTESVLLAVPGGALGVLLARWGLALTTTLARELSAGGIESAASITLSGPVLGFALLGTVAATLLFGTYPALHFTRRPLEAVLRAHGRSLTGSFSRHRMLRTLVLAQVALAFVLVLGAGLLLRSLVRLQRTSAGFDDAALLAAQLTRPAATRQQSAEQRAAFVSAVITRLNALPGVLDATAVNVLPFTGDNHAQGFSIEGGPATPAGFLVAELRMVSPSYHRVLGIPLRRGRVLEAADDGRHSVILVDETFVRRFFPNENPLGRTLLILHQPHEIVGIVGNVKDRGLGETDLLPHFYVPLAQRSTTRLSFLIRTAQEPAGFAHAVSRVVAEIDAAQPVQRVAVIRELAARTVAPNRLSARLIAAFAGFALVLSTLGVYGVIAFSVAQRTRELAIRMAFGAQREHILGSVLGQTAGLVVSGLALGGLTALALQRVLASFLYELSPFDPVSLAAALLALIGTALLAGWLPAFRATRVDPMLALRAE